MIKFRIFATCLDGAGASIPVTWYGNGSIPEEAIQKMVSEAQSNGWIVGSINRIQQKQVSGMEAAA